MIESNHDFWTRLALDEFRVAMIWRRMKRFKEARHSIALVREWKEIAAGRTVK